MEDWWLGILGVPLSSTRNPNHLDPNHQFTLSWNKIHQTYFPGSQQIPLKPNESPELHSGLGPLGFFYSNFWTFSDDDLIFQMAKNVPNLMLIVCRTETHVWCDDFVLCRTFDPLKCNTVLVGWRTPVHVDMWAAESENPISSACPASSCIWCWSGCHRRPSLPPTPCERGC